MRTATRRAQNVAIRPWRNAYWRTTAKETCMCDYSLHQTATRQALVADQLVTATFENSFTRGFVALGDPEVAVCLQPGTEVAFEREVECDPTFGFGIVPTRKIRHRLARFRCIDVHNPTAHHDALEFPDGRIVLLTRLRIGQRARVLQLPQIGPDGSETNRAPRSAAVVRT
jgi:hypothetical protein